MLLGFVWGGGVHKEVLLGVIEVVGAGVSLDAAVCCIGSLLGFAVVPEHVIRSDRYVSI